VTKLKTRRIKMIKTRRYVSGGGVCNECRLRNNASGIEADERRADRLRV
jgi:hypothetical protein